VSFYNVPYLFGLLFGLGLYARYRQDPRSFRTRYDELLSSTGRADAATLVAQFGIDLRAPAFCYDSLETVRESIARFEAIVEREFPQADS
jgi:oligoendopeptidase F